MFPNPIISFDLFGQEFKIYLYGLCIGIGILACMIIFFVYTKKKGIDEKVSDFTFFVAILAIALGFLAAKFFQAVYNWIGSGFTKFNFYDAGITAMGGIVGGVITFLLAYFFGGKLLFKEKELLRQREQFNIILLVAPICVSIAHAIGRIGCLFGGCCHGAYLGKEPVPGGIYMEGVEYGWGYYVPVQLYEAIFLFILTAVLSVLYFKRFNITHVVYLISYGVWRFVIEFFRGDSVFEGVEGVKSIFDILSPSQWQSIIFILVGVAILIIYKKKKIPYILPDGKNY